MDIQHQFFSGFRGNRNKESEAIEHSSGFQSAADDYLEKDIDLNECLVQNKLATYFMRMGSDAMVGAGVHHGDILIVDRSVKAESGKIVVAVVDGEMVVRRLEVTINSTRLVPESKHHKVVVISEFNRLDIWGVVVYVIHAL
jgi:DNA polymerase V